MAALATLSTPARQPFGILHDSKIRNLQSMKNRQNAITPSSAPSLKRRAVSPEAGSDSENVDPNILDSWHKRKRSAFEDDVSASKSNRYSLDVIKTTDTFCSIKRGLDAPLKASTPRVGTFVKPATITPASAPAAGRSPTKKRSGLLQSRKRFNPPAFSLATPAPGLSLSAALSGTKKSRQEHQSRKSQHRRITSTIEDGTPNSWLFDIFEETQETQEYRMNEWTMTQSTTGLDISDDEAKASFKSSEHLDRGKENVDPNEMSVPRTRSMAATARKEKEVNAMTDEEPRTPLGDLDPTEFYAEGLSETSVVLVHDDDAEAETDIEDETKEEAHDFTFEASTPASSSTSLSLTARAIESLDVPSIGQILSSATAAPFKDYAELAADVAPQPGEEAAEIEIWESESAKDENEEPAMRPTFFESAKTGDAASPPWIDEENVFALQEL